MKNNKMKNTILVSVFSLVILLIAGDLFAQNGQGRRDFGDRQGRNNGDRMERFCNRLDLTEDQQVKMDDLRIKQMKNMLTIRNEIRENNAHRRTLRTADKADMKAINASVDNATELKNKQMKLKESHIQDVRNILTDEQKVKFDTFKSRDNGRGFGRGDGNCDRFGKRDNRGNRDFGQRGNRDFGQRGNRDFGQRGR